MLRPHSGPAISGTVGGRPRHWWVLAAPQVSARLIPIQVETHGANRTDGLKMIRASCVPDS